MKAFTVTAHSVTVGLRIRKEPYPHVQMGELQEHQTARWVSLAPNEWPELPASNVIERCSVKRVAPRKKDRDQQTLLITPERTTDRPNHALVLVDIRGREGGEAVWTHARKKNRACPLRGINGVIHDICPLCGSEYTHGMHPNAGYYMDYDPFPARLMNIVKKGHIRYDDEHPLHPGAKEPKWGVVYLLEMHPDAIFRVDRGYGKGQANDRFVRWTGEHLELGSANQILHERMNESTADTVIEDEEIFVELRQQA